MLPIYGKILSTNKSTPFYPLTERHLQIIWAEQKYFSHLQTKEGKKIIIISSGTWNEGSGPDFLNAHLKIGNHYYRGAVEIHLEEKGWFDHHHDKDSRYNEVILHLFYSPFKNQQEVCKENGLFPFSASIENYLTVSPTELTHLIDLDLYPSSKFIEKGHCSDALFAGLSEKETRSLLISAAYWRLDRKARFLSSHFSDPSMQFIGGIASALGYKQNAIAFMELFSFLFEWRDLPYEEFLAIALGCCNFLEEERKKEWIDSAYYQLLQQLWWGQKNRVNHQSFLKLDRIRPLNHPIRRLVYLTRLLQHPMIETFWDSALFLWKEHIQLGDGASKNFKEKFFSLFPVFKDPYWDSHYLFEKKASLNPIPSIGVDLKTHVLLNTFLPILYTKLIKEEENDGWKHFQAFYVSITQAHTSKTRYLHSRFFHKILDEKLLKNAQMAQGAYQLHQDFCLQFEASCKGCPFVERYLHNFSNK